MITKEHARLFCSVFNRAIPGMVVNVMPDMTFIVSGKDLPGSWVSKTKRKGESIGSTQEAFDLLTDWLEKSVDLTRRRNQ